MWLIFRVVIILQLCEHESAIYEWAYRQMFGENLPRFYYEHWGTERLGWIYLFSVWGGFLATIEVARVAAIPLFRMNAKSVDPIAKGE